MRVRLDGRYADALREVDRIVLAVLRRDPEDGRQQVVGAGQILERDAHLVARMELHVEPELRLDLANGAGQVLTRLLGFQDGRIGIENPHQSGGPGTLHQALPGKRGRDNERNTG